MIKKHERTLLKVSKYFEVALSVIILILVLLGMLDLLRTIYEAYIINFQTPVDYSQLNKLFGARVATSNRSRACCYA